MSWLTDGNKPTEVKFLVDLQKHTYISEKSHQEIIDQAGLNPAGYDNYLKGWVKSDGTIKLWVETIEDVALRYFDQIKLAFRILIKENLTKTSAKTYAIVNRIDRFAGAVRDFLNTSKREQYFDKKLGLAVHFYGKTSVAKGQPVVLLVNYKMTGNRYLLAGTRGQVMTGGSSAAKRLRIKWVRSVSGLMKPMSGVTLLTDRRFISQV
jgi:hypothetical protein